MATIERTIDFSGLDALFAEKILWEMGGEKARGVIDNLLKQNASKKEILAYFRRRFPSWTATADRLDVVIDYVQRGGGEE